MWHVIKNYFISDIVFGNFYNNSVPCNLVLLDDFDICELNWLCKLGYFPRFIEDISTIPIAIIYIR